MKTDEKRPATKPTGLMDLHVRLTNWSDRPSPDDASLLAFADEVVRACDDSAAEMRRRVFEAVVKLRDA